MARKRKGIALNGIIVIDKPQGLSSNQVLQRVKRLFNAQKAGHTGSLDPMATGVLPICFGQATRISQYLLDADKAYQATIQLGISTDSGDAEGNIIEQHEVPEIALESIHKVLREFRGEINQIPPMYSALKHQGKPLYKLARQGVEIERKARNITIYTLELINYNPEKHTIDIDVRCSKGTYIRTLGMDIAKALDCAGHLIKLTRSACGLLTMNDAFSLEMLRSLTLDLCYEKLLNPEYAFTDTPIFTIPNDKVDLFYLKGKMQLTNDFTGSARIYDQDRFVALGHFSDGELVKKQLFLQGIIENEQEIHD
ncbi:tRNA pseudouridine(55) synthase TruB [Cysteiniphilum halobium]|uniref:tRNA pseudouridine(55) synthase TruB n=1 Tax=Cysteiniphilum halobium TaxID=2219059 RepID=UPI003F8262AE